MATSEEHLRALLGADAEERVRAVRTLLESLEDEPEDLAHEDAWHAEIGRRAEGIAGGHRTTVDGDEALARVRARVTTLAK